MESQKERLTVDTKICTKCGEMKSLDEFSSAGKTSKRRGIGKKRGKCKLCERTENRAKRGFIEPEILPDGMKQCSGKHSKCGQIKPLEEFHKKGEGNDKRRPECIDCFRIWYEATKPIRDPIRRTNENQRRKNDLAFRLRKNISGAVGNMFRSNGTKKPTSFLTAIGYTMEELVGWLAEHFEWWMTKDNFGSYRRNTWDDNNPSTWTWNIDHIIPQSDLPFTSYDDENFHKCWELSNLRPLNAKQNLIDGASRTRHKKIA